MQINEQCSRGFYMKVKKDYLLFIASVVWMIAGFKVSRLGFIAYGENIGILNIFLTVLIYGFFQFMIFGKMVKKHSQRIISYDENQYFWKFFDKKSFLIMAFMMSFGIGLRNLAFVSERFIAVFYTGLGLALFMAGFLFLINFFEYNRKKELAHIFK